MSSYLIIFNNSRQILRKITDYSHFNNNLIDNFVGYLQVDTNTTTLSKNNEYGIY